MARVAVVHWDEEGSRYVPQETNADRVRFYLGDPPAIIEIRALGDSAIEIHGSGTLWIRPDAANQIIVGQVKP